MIDLDDRSFELATTILAGTNELALGTLRKDGSPHVTTVNFANDGLTLYIAIALDSLKAHDLGLDPRVSLAINLPTANWKEIQGLTMEGNAELLRGDADLALASALLLMRVPAYASVIADPHTHPWPGMLFLKIVPHHLTLLDYTKGFGFSQAFQAQERAAAS